MEVDMVLYIALDEEISKPEESIVGLRDGCDKGVLVFHLAVAAHCRVENEGIQLDRDQNRPLKHWIFI